MEKKNKISLSILFLIIIIVIMALFLYKLNLKITEVESTVLSFSEMMNMLYTQNSEKIGENEYEITPSDYVCMLYEDASENITDIEYTDVAVYDGEINFNMNKVDPDKNISTTIEGISEEVVSIKILQIEGEGTPSVVYFLTRNGNIYYIDEEMINSNNFIVKQLDNLKEIVSIEIVDAYYVGSMHGSTTLIATTYSGEKIDVLN
jgi:hypothetical protein